MTVNQQLDHLKTDENFEVGEVFAVFAQYGALPAFDQKLWDAIVAADVHELEKLYRGFPDEVSGYTAWGAGEIKNKLARLGYTL